MAEVDFGPAIEKVLAWEGGYVNDTVDPGGETNFGISKSSYPSVNIRALTREAAIAIYHRDFWVPLSLAQLQPTVAAKVLDMAVNVGQRRAVLLLQRSVNAMSPGLPVKVDGVIGPLTIAEANAKNDYALLAQLRLASANYYQGIAADHPALRRYLNGWLRRARA